MATVAEKNVLIAVIDVSQFYELSMSSEVQSQVLSFQHCIDQITVFINSYLLSSHCNSVAVILCHQLGSTLVYPVPNQAELDEAHPELNKGKYEPIGLMNGLLRERINQFMLSISENIPALVSSSTLLSGALSMSLCYAQRCSREATAGETIKPRLLVIRASTDAASQHIATMNCIFAAQKQNIPIDCCALWEDSSFMQQATDITGGIYIKIPEPAGLLQFLLWVFLPDIKSRSSLQLPQSSVVDYRASCFCDQKLVDTGFVCSVCLAIFCKFTPICPVCQAHFKLPSLPQLKSKKKGKSSSKSKAKQ
ncbi:PREDICTED: general transcription factor IIH subunit 3-like [Amphimedon queenslandica]|uniref:General transcription factor IIH subunit 3 n=1 Tax=Amphimedon queenslandica TaxID=400682 RepID=A0A1X7VAN0_AMPQE|nr:PREDICTED: general transcription factor IIH subunit 3-like [Amphimedon queenslandica]|eukprot:XP_019850097.1 PREDICTED: general transcription factor IIH subunit 3-like [Amphimedon queenslandica]